MSDDSLSNLKRLAIQDPIGFARRLYDLEQSLQGIRERVKDWGTKIEQLREANELLRQWDNPRVDAYFKKWNS